MANNINNNPISIDTVGSVLTTSFLISYIQPVGNADNWEVVLKDSENGKEIFRATNALVGDRGIGVSFRKDGQSNIGRSKVSGIYANTLTNITEVLVYGVYEQNNQNLKGGS